MLTNAAVLLVGDQAAALAPRLQSSGYATLDWSAGAAALAPDPQSPPQLAVVSTDHCPFCMKDQKELGLGNFSAIPNGIGSIEHRMELLYQGVVNGEITLERWVETCSTTPAAS